MLLESAADKDERDTPQDDLPLSTLTTEEQKESTETGTDGEVTDSEGKEEREGSSSTEEITDASQPQPPLPSPLPVSNEETREKEEEEEEEEEEKEEDLATGGEAKRESEPKEGEIIPPLPSPYQTFPFTPSLDESEPPTLENEGSLDNPAQEATDTEESIPDSTKKGEKAVSNSLISYDIITEVDPKSLESNARKVNIAKESDGSNMNKEGKANHFIIITKNIFMLPHFSV